MNKDTLRLPPPRALVEDGAILALWLLGRNTVEIANDLRISHAEAANRLARLRDAVHA